jgi:hypothetical protein
MMLLLMIIIGRRFIISLISLISRVMLLIPNHSVQLIMVRHHTTDMRNLHALTLRMDDIIWQTCNNLLTSREHRPETCLPTALELRPDQPK